ncbi:MAG TPA: glycosyltransferase [Anaerohalosphaeraceae bacterium]|nr:glycosyltransferase [Anaerohalosphaeraceae bacterium]HOL89091.1 glycosyltransferase [Anaerohalosphaeraceae bacterium]HPP56631.1 glycosyltransferase [Anaerohalosphaeraceae bacterium]
MSRTNGIATICVVNYKTLDLTRLCLRSIRKYTRGPYEMVVVDNNSQDESLEYLKSLPWIRLMERKDPTNDSSGGYAHAAALDWALQECRTEFFVSLHSDTVVHRERWLDLLLEPFRDEPKMACVGGGKVELEETWRVWLKKATDYKTFFRKLFRVPDPLGRYRYYNRTVCCAYRTEILKKENLSFLMDRDKGLTVGQKLYFELEDRGYKTVRIPDRVLKQYVFHLAHATQVVNQKQYNLQRRTIKKIQKRIKAIMESELIRSILSEDSLDC